MDFLQEKILDNSVQNLLIVSGTILLVVLFQKLLAHSLASFIYLFISRRWKIFDQQKFSRMFFKPLSWFLIITVCLAALSRLTYPGAWELKIYKITFYEILEKAGVIIFIYSFFRLLFSVIDFVSLILAHRAKLTVDKTDDQLVVFFRDFLKAILAIVGVLLVLKAGFNQNIGNLLTGLSIVGAALALSARESLENLIASFIIFFDKPFFVGDLVRVNAVTGTVERIGLRSTRIRTADKTLVTVPNKQMVDSIVDNWSMRTNLRVEIKLEIGHQSKPESAQRLIEKIKTFLGKQSAISSSAVYMLDYSKTGATLTIEYFTAIIPAPAFNLLKQQVNLELMRLVSEEEITLASPNSITIVQPNAPDAPRQRPIL